MPNTPKLSTADSQKVVDGYLAGRPIRDITKEFGISATTVRSCVSRANATLRPVGRPKSVDA